MTCIDDVIAELGERQAGTVARRQLIEAGVGPTTVRRAVERDRLVPILRGVYRIPGAPITGRQALWAAHLATGPSSAVSHGSAGRIWGLEAIQRCAPTLTVPHGCAARALSGVVVHRSRLLDAIDTVSDRGLPVTTPARTIVDLAGEYSRPRLSAVLEGAHFSRIVSYTEVGESLLRVGGAGRQGTRLLGAVLDEHAGGEDLAQSVLERLLGELLRRSGIHHFVRQHPLPSLGAIKGMVDAYVDDARMITEVDGRRWHARQADMKRDRDRDFAALQMGVVTVRFLHEHLTSDMDGCAHGLQAVLADRRGHGRGVHLL